MSVTFSQWSFKAHKIIYDFSAGDNSTLVDRQNDTSIKIKYFTFTLSGLLMMGEIYNTWTKTTPPTEFKST